MSSPGSATDRFEAWLRAPLADFPGRAGYEVRRATPEHFEAVYDLVDRGFGVVRPRALYDWLYRRNPEGPARCITVVESATGGLVSTGAHFPWPCAIGGEPVPGSIGGDSTVLPHLRGRGLDALRLEAWRAHPDRRETVTVGWPNADSVRHAVAQGLAGMLVGPLRRLALRLGARAGRLRFERWRDRLRGSVPAGTRVEIVSRFDERIEPAATRFMRSEGIWFPRSREFLDWRYLAHPAREYRAIVALRGEELLGFCVVNLDGKRATLTELAAPPTSEESAALLSAAADVAREAGCQRISFFATDGFGQWDSLLAAGFVPVKSEKMAFLNRFGSVDVDSGFWSVTPAEDEAL